MKRLIWMMAVCVLTLGLFVLPASAESAASRVESQISVSAQGDCFVTSTVTLRMESINNGMTFPLPANATNISVNNASASVIRTSAATQVDISRLTGGMTGEFSILFSYTIPEAVHVVKVEDTNAKTHKYVLQLELPLLSGFELPVENLSFVVNMPSAAMTDSPVFTSTYRQSSVASDLTVKVDGTQIIGSSKVTMNDHDGVTMTMFVPGEMFPTISTYVREGNPELVPMLVCAGLALLYWLIFLRCAPLIRRHSITAPAGITAGELGCRLTLAGGDLTMMVFSWAQLGYLTMHFDGERVILEKRMDMGNERSPFEVKIFRLLFGSRQMVDATGKQYAKLCMKVLALVPGERNANRKNSGNMKIFRALCCGVQIFAGINVAMNLTDNPVLQVILSVILSIFAAVSAWLIQAAPYRTHLRGKVPVYMSLSCILIWIILGACSGMIWIPMGAAFGQLLLGYFAAYGGRRSELGRSDAGQILGLRSYLKHLPQENVDQMMAADPEYYHNLAPYALALGVINPYSNAFGHRKIGNCPYLHLPTKNKQTAQEWGQTLADIADRMDAKSRRLQIERWIPSQITHPTPKTPPRNTKRRPR